MRWRGLAGLVGLLAGPLAFASAASAETWSRFVNDRFGATIEYPARFSILAEPPANSDGQRFYTADRRAELAVFGFFDVENETPKRMMDRRRQAGVTYTLAAANAASFTLSGLRRDRITYERCLRSRVETTIFVCVTLDYPADRRREFDPVVSRVSRSLTAGKPW